MNERGVGKVYDWYRKALAGENPPVYSEPECGYFLMKRSKGNFVPASIYWDGPRDDEGRLIGDETLLCEVGGDFCDPEEQWLYLAKRVVSFEEYSMYMAKMFGGNAA